MIVLWLTTATSWHASFVVVTSRGRQPVNTTLEHQVRSSLSHPTKVTMQSGCWLAPWTAQCPLSGGRWWRWRVCWWSVEVEGTRTCWLHLQWPPHPCCYWRTQRFSDKPEDKRSVKNSGEWTERKTDGRTVTWVSLGPLDPISMMSASSWNILFMLRVCRTSRNA